MKPPIKRRLPVLGAAAQWVDTTCHWGPRLVRTFLHEVARPITPARHQPAPAGWTSAAVTAAWLGHASVLINFFGLTIVTDPVLSSRIGATFGRRTIGPKRLIAAALTVDQLPP